MSSTENLLKATISRLQARLGQSIIDFAAEMAVLSKKVPERLKKEFALFQEEVVAEAIRLDNENGEEASSANNDSQSPKENDYPQEKIDLIRNKIANLNQKIEDIY